MFAMWTFRKSIRSATPHFTSEKKAKRSMGAARGENGPHLNNPGEAVESTSNRSFRYEDLLRNLRRETFVAVGDVVSRKIGSEL